MSRSSPEKNSIETVRLDKWLWAARFWKTRTLAKEAIEGGKVFYNGARCKTSKVVEIGATVCISRGQVEQTVEIIALSIQRQGAPEASLLYRETPESQQKREEEARIRQQTRAVLIAPPEKPGKKNRRLIHQFKRQSSE